MSLFYINESFDISGRPTIEKDGKTIPLRDAVALLNKELAGEWVETNLLLPEDETVVLGSQDDDVFECRHVESGTFEFPNGQPVDVEYWMSMPGSPYQAGQVKA